MASELERRALLTRMIQCLRVAVNSCSAIYPVVLKRFLFGEFPSLLRYKISLNFPGYQGKSHHGLVRYRLHTPPPLSAQLVVSAWVGRGVANHEICLVSQRSGLLRQQLRYCGNCAVKLSQFNGLRVVGQTLSQAVALWFCQVCRFEIEASITSSCRPIVRYHRTNDIAGRITNADVS